MGLGAVQAGERRAEILGNSPGSAASPWDSGLHPLPFLQDGISRELEQGKRQGSTVAVLGMDPGGKGKQEMPIPSFHPFPSSQSKGFVQMQREAIEPDADGEEGGAGTSNHAQEPQGGEGAPQAPLLPSELPRFGTSCRIPAPRAAGMHGQGPEGLQQISSLNQTPPVLISAGTSGLTHRTSSKSSSPPPDPT